MTATQPRYDYYQTDTAVNLSVFVKGLTDGDVDVSFGEHSLSMSLRPAAAPALTLDLQLYDTIDSGTSSYKVLSTKVDVLLTKKKPGRRWQALEAEGGGKVPSYETAIASSTTPSAAASTSSTSPQSTEAATVSLAGLASRPRSKWDTLELDDDDDDGTADAGSSAPAGSAAKGSGSSGGGIDAFFQKLYADADDDTKRAMMKSYTESGGTSLSTNWKEVGKGKMETKPPEGMEARKW